jgi:hypothetical protein
MDNTVRTREDLQEAMEGLPVLGHIPRIREAVSANGRNGKRRKTVTDPLNQSQLVTGRDPRNPVSEAYRSLRTNITFVNPERAPKTLVLTSPTPGDGKSTSSSNLAVTLAQQGDFDAALLDGFTLLHVWVDHDSSKLMPLGLLAVATLAAAIRGTDLRQIKVSDDDFGLLSYDPAFMNTAACRSAITHMPVSVGSCRSPSDWNASSNAESHHAKSSFTSSSDRSSSGFARRPANRDTRASDSTSPGVSDRS